MSSSQTLSRSASRPAGREVLVWGSDEVDNEMVIALEEALKRSPSLCLSTYGEANSFCLDILTLPHNAARQELSDMFTMYRAMADLGCILSYHDVKTSTLWFRTFAKFLLRNVLAWQDESLFPWVCRRAKLDVQRCPWMAELYVGHEKVVKLTQAVLTRQAHLSKEVSGEGGLELVQMLLLDVVVRSVELAFEVAEYLREVERFIGPMLHEKGITSSDRDALFTQMSLRIQEAGTERMDIPMLIRWMAWRDQKLWIKTHLIDCKRKSISLSTYNQWQNDHFDLLHRRFVEDMLQKARRC